MLKKAGSFPPSLRRCAVAQQTIIRPQIGGARRTEAVVITGVFASERESGPHGIGVESLLAQHAVTTYRRVNPFATV